MPSDGPTATSATRMGAISAPRFRETRWPTPTRAAATDLTAAEES